jgi:hypothetical protein
VAEKKIGENGEDHNETQKSKNLKNLELHRRLRAGWAGPEPFPPLQEFESWLNDIIENEDDY